MPTINLEICNLETIRTVNPRLMSYNVEMTEVTGGTFWKAYTPGQIAGTEKFPPIANHDEQRKLMQWFDPIDSTNPRLRKLAKELGPLWVRCSGTWATKTYYDFDDKGAAPEGYQNRLTKQQWKNLIDFVNAVDAKLIISFANCQGLHSAEEPWNPSQAKKIMDLSIEFGHPVDAVCFTNEPNVLERTGFPKGYTVEHFHRDQDIFHKWIRANYPDVLIVGPDSTDGTALKMGPTGVPAGEGLSACTTAELLEGCEEKVEVFSYHYYSGISERLASIMPNSHWPADTAHTDAYLAVPGNAARAFAVQRDQLVHGAEMWVTESGDSAGGGSTWASTYMAVLRTLNEAAEFCTITDGVIFHNTLASSDYGWLKHGTYLPRPNYFAVLLWNRLMGNTVYDAKAEGHIYCHSRKDGKDGCVYLVINNSLSDVTTVNLPKEAEVYALAGKDGMRSTVMTLNGNDLVLGENDELPDLSGKAVPADTLEIAPGSCTFIVL
ncbi:MAG: beta-glucuronidase [Oscillospiraceae bacterium]|nr:beta-glucuronidase [Oscillospiraceae bacterium]